MRASSDLPSDPPSTSHKVRHHTDSPLTTIDPQTSAAVAQVVDFYLDEKNVKHREEIQRLIKTNDKASDEKLQGYVREAMS